MATAKKLRYSLTEDQHTASWETAADTEYDNAPTATFHEVADPEYEVPVDPDYDVGADPDYDDSAQVDYDQPADPDYGDELPALPEEATPARALAPSPAFTESFAYALGHQVQPEPALTAEVIWRGQLKERHPTTGLMHRVNVYRLNDGHWDCYREDELRAA